MKKITGSFLLFLSFLAAAEPDSCKLKISLLTCTPGHELYSTFGHSAIRVLDSASQTDLVFNYGTFDFYDPAFYKKFVKGKLLYFVSIDTLNSFLREYQYYKRGVTEQTLDLSCEEKQRMRTTLFENAREENRYYRYDFNYDNCTSRLRDMLEKITGKPIQASNILPHPRTSFRHLIHDYLHSGGQYWSKLGIDILLGSPLDKKITNREAMFLPDYLMMAFDSTTLNGHPLVMEKKTIVSPVETEKSNPFFTPFILFSLLLVVIGLLSFFRKKWLGKFFRVFDLFFFFMLGLLGALLVFMWFGTDHAMCRNNYNLLWALPTHLPAAVILLLKKKWINNYFRFIFFYSLGLLLAWMLLPQQFNPALLPVLGIVLVRSFFISRNSAATN